MINDFHGKYYFLSNFYNSPIEWEGVIYTNNEAAFQSAKVLDIKVRREFSLLPPNIAKSKGRHVKLRSDWESVKFNIMLEIVRNKFTQNKALSKLLIETGDEELIEGNTWRDSTWGVYKGVGTNWLGKILMLVRDELK